jgi:hypothetical protein
MEQSISAFHWGGLENSGILWPVPAQDLQSNPISGNISEELLFQKSSNWNLTSIPTPSANYNCWPLTCKKQPKALHSIPHRYTREFWLITSQLPASTNTSKHHNWTGAWPSRCMNHLSTIWTNKSAYLTSGMGSTPATYILWKWEGSTLPMFLSFLVQPHRLGIIPKPGSSTTYI